jgi:hypothetical protein
MKKLKNLEQFQWDCGCTYRNTGWWKDAEFAECDDCGNMYSWEELNIVEYNEADYDNYVFIKNKEIENECPCSECNGRYWHYEFCSKYLKNHDPLLKR